jgi:TP901 family phage tail tape measure protein
MSDNKLGIVIELKFDDDNTNLKNLTTALTKLQEKVNKNGLNVGLNFNNKDFDNAVKNIENQVQRVQKQIDVLNNTKLQILNGKDMDVQIKGTLTSLEQLQKSLKNIGMYNQGEVKIKITDIDKDTNAIKNFIVTVKDAQGILKTFESSKGFLPAQGSELNLQGYNLNLKSITDTSDAVITKLSEFKTKYNEILEGLKSFNLLDINDVNKVGEVINNLTNDAKKVDFENIKNQVKGLENSLSEAQKIKGLGTNLGTGTGLNLNSSIAEVEKYIQTLNNGEASVKFFSSVLEENGTKMRQINYTVNDGNGYVGKYKMTIDEASNSVYNLERGFTAVNEKGTSFGSNLKDMITNITGVSLGLMAVYKSLDLLKSGFNDALSLQSALAQINVTMNTSQQQLQQLSGAVVEQSKKWGLNATEIENAMKVYANMNETVSSITTKTNSDLILSKLSGLPTTTTTDSIQSAISQFDLQAKDSQKVVDILTSVSSNMSMDFSKGIEQIIEGLKVSGSTAKDAGLSLSEYSSILGSVIEKTRLSGSTIGQGEKSIFSRIEKVRNGAAVDDEGQDLSKTETILRSQGIEIRKDADSFKPMSDILQTISEKFKTASDTEKAYIADAAAGITQRNVFISTIDAYSKAMDLNSKAMNSNGFAQSQVGKIMDTTQSKIEQLKATVQGMFLQTVDSKGMGIMVDDLKGLAEGFSNVVQHVGLMNTAIIALSTGMMTFNKNMQIFQATGSGMGLTKGGENLFNNMKNGLDDYTSSWRKHYTELSFNTQQYGLFTDAINKSKAGVSTLKDGINTLAASTAMETIAATAMNAVIGMGIGILISFAIEGIMKLVNAQKDLAQSNKEITDSVSNNIQSNNSNIKSLQDIQKEYDSLKDKTNLTSDEMKRYNDICTQIAGVNKDATITYDSQGKAILNMKGNVDDLIKSLKEKNQLENLKLENNIGNQYKEYNDVANKNKPNSNDSSYRNMSGLNDIDEQLKKAKESLVEYEKQRDALIKGSKDTTKIDSNITDIENQIDSLTNKVKQSKLEQDTAFNSLKTNITAILKDGSKYNDIFDKMDSSTQKLVTDGDFLKTIFKPNGDINTETQQYKKFLETIANSDSYKKAQSNMQDLSDSQKDTVNKLMSGFNINDFAKTDKNGNNKMDEYYKIMVKIEDIAKDGVPTFDQFKKALSGFPDAKNLSSDDWKKLFDSMSGGAKDASDSIKNTIQSVEELQKTLDSNLTKANNYSKMLNEIKDKGIISESSQKEILTKKDYQDLLPFLNNMNGLSTELSKRIDDIKTKSVGLFAAMGTQQESQSIQDLLKTYTDLSGKEKLEEEDKEKLNQVIEQLKGKVEGFVETKGKDDNATKSNITLTNDRIKSLDNEQKYLQLVATVGQEKAKDQMATEILKTDTTYREVQARIKAYQDEANAMNYGGDGRQTAKQQEDMLAMMKIDDAVKSGEEDLNKARKQAGDIINNLSKDTGTNTEATKANTAAQKELNEQVKQAQELAKDYDNTLKALDDTMYGLDSNMQGMDETSQKYRDSLKQKIDLLKQKTSVTKDYISSNEKQSNALLTTSGKSGGSAVGQQVVADAEKYLGTPYAWGGESPSGFDCSGLVQYVYNQVGVNLNRRSQDQFSQGTPVEKSELQAGDLVFFKGSDVRTASLNDRSDYVGARRIVSGSASDASSSSDSSDTSSTSSTTTANIPKGSFSSAESFLDAIAPYAETMKNKYGITPSLLLSQAMAESANGSSSLSKNDNNYFGMTWTGSNGTKGTVRPEGGNYVHYDNMAQSVEAYGKLLSSYYGVSSTDGFDSGLEKVASKGYAADPNYRSLVQTKNNQYNLSSYDTGTHPAAASLNYDSLISQAQTLQGKTQDLQKTLTDYTRKMLEDYTKMYESQTKLYDQEVSDSNKTLENIKAKYKLYEDGTNINNNSSFQYKEQEWKEINNQYGILEAKEAFIESQINSNVYDDKTLTEIKQNLVDVQNQETETVNNLHDAFKDWLTSMLTWKTQGFKDNIDMLNSQLSLSNDKDSSNNFGKKINLNQQILGKNQQINGKIKEQIDYVQNLLNHEQNGETRTIWQQQLQDLYKQLVQNNDEIVKSIKTVEDAKINEILDNTDKKLKLVAQDLKDIDFSSKDISDSDTSTKLINEVNKAQDYMAELKEDVNSYNQIYAEVSKDGVISTDDQAKLDTAKSKIDSVNDSLQTTKQTINSLNLANILQPFENMINSITNNVSKLNYKLQMLGTTDYSGKANIINQELLDNNSKQSNLMDEYNQLMSQNVTKGTKEADEYKNKLATVRDTLMQTSQEGLNLKKSLQDANLSSMFQEIDKPQIKIDQEISNIDFQTSMGQNKGLALGNNFVDDTQNYIDETEKQTEEVEKVSDAVDAINGKINGLQSQTYDIDTSNITSTMENTTNTTNNILTNIKGSIDTINANNNQIVEKKNVYGSGSDLSNFEELATKFGVSNLFNTVDTSKTGFLWNSQKITSNDVVLGGTGAVNGANSSVETNGADRLSGEDSNETNTKIMDYIKSIAELLKTNNSASNIDDTASNNKELLTALGVDNTNSTNIATNTGNEVTGVETQTSTLTSVDATNAKSIVDTLNTSKTEIEDKIDITNTDAEAINTILTENISNLGTNLTSIITRLGTIDTNNTSELNQVLQELINLHTSVNLIGSLIGTVNSINFSGTAPVAIQTTTKAVDKKAHGNLDPSILGDGEGNNKGAELVVNKKTGETRLIGGNGYTLVPDLDPENDIVVSHEDTQKVLSQGGIQKVSKHANGTIRVFAKSDLNKDESDDESKGLYGDYENAKGYIDGLGRKDITVINIDEENNITPNDFVLGTSTIIGDTKGATRINGGIDRRKVSVK